MQTRREFLRASSKAMVALSLTPMAGLAANPEAAPQDRFSYQTFSQLVRTPFRSVGTDAAPQKMILVKAEELSRGKGHECFALLFRSTGQGLKDQGTHRFVHATLGEFDMFVVPKPGDGRAHYCEAIFNRIA